MIANIKTYLTVTRGKNNFKDSHDDIVSLLINKLNSTLQKNKINVVVIWSTFAKNEIITNEDGTKTIIWDTNYWTHCAYYYNNLVILNQHIKNNSELIEVQCDALWRDLFKVIISRSNHFTSKTKMLLTKYYLSYGTRSYPFEADEKTATDNLYNQLTDVATAKVYVFLHEIAHITATNDNDYYIDVLKRIFSEELKESVFYQILDADSALGTQEKQYLKRMLDSLIADINSGVYESVEEIIADMRALQSMCNSFMLTFPDEVPNGFLRYRDGIALARSFNLRIRFIEKVIHDLYHKKHTENIQKLLYESPFGKKFIIRDKLSEIIQPFIFIDSFGKRCDKTFLFKYDTQSKISNNTVTTVGYAIASHLEKIRVLMENEIKMPCKDDFEHSVDGVIDYLLFYSAEEEDNKIINSPTQYYGVTGLLF